MSTPEAAAVRIRCGNCGHTQDPQSAMADLRADIGAGVTLKLGQTVEMICWECGVTEPHTIEKASAA